MLIRVLLLALLAAAAGCGKPASPSPKPPEPQAPAVAAPAEPSTESAPAEPAPPPAVMDEAQIATAIAELTQAVRKYGVEQRRAPKSLDELVAQGYLSRVPEAPAGKKFAIDKNLAVYLADR
jgi:hypothetical protein